jgi:two-component system, OmpR family, sensor histidine kinase CpxA
MIRRAPLYAKILGWFFLNLAAIGAASWLLLRDQFRFTALPARVAGDHVEQAAAKILADATPRPLSEWNEVLATHSKLHGVDFRILAGDGRPLAGGRDPLPPEVHSRLFGPPRGEPPPPRWSDDGFPPPPDGRRPPRGERPPGPPRGNPFDEPPPRPPFEDDPPPRGRSFTPVGNVPSQVVMQSSNPDRYWVIVRATASHPEFRNGGFVVASSDSPTGHGFYFDITPYVWWGAGVLALSVLIWFPFVRGLTRSISRMRNATGALAQGKFDAQVEERRRDELGELGREINRMAARLAGYMNGQKRFLGDVAHELSAPTARLQMALAILDQRATTAADRERVSDAREEAEQMGSLVNELLQFSRASVSGQKGQLQATNLRAIAEKAVRREASDTSQVGIEIAPELAALADPDLLLRALANLLRNAIRYAGHGGPIRIRAEKAAGSVQLTVEDRGPGIPPSELPRIFEPFYRVDVARTPGMGGAVGAGLGLAIVTTCVQGCGGSVSARNVAPSGLEVTIQLRALDREPNVPEPHAALCSPS